MSLVMATRIVLLSHGFAEHLEQRGFAGPDRATIATAARSFLVRWAMVQRTRQWSRSKQSG
jgi:hypothetical protein